MGVQQIDQWLAGVETDIQCRMDQRPMITCHPVPVANGKWATTALPRQLVQAGGEGAVCLARGPGVGRRFAALQGFRVCNLGLRV